jgi:hypothetical protein
MATSKCTTIQCTFDGYPLAKEWEDVLISIVDQACKDVAKHMKAQAEDPLEFEQTVSFAWSAIPHEDKLGSAHYAILILGQHEVEPVREAVDTIRRTFRDKDFAAEIGVLPL